MYNQILLHKFVNGQEVFFIDYGNFKVASGEVTEIRFTAIVREDENSSYYDVVYQVRNGINKREFGEKVLFPSKEELLKTL